MIYSFVVVHQGHCHDHFQDEIQSTNHAHVHHYAGFDTPDHPPHFHEGLFHFLEHVFENIAHPESYAVDHVSSNAEYLNKAEKKNILAPDLAFFVFLCEYDNNSFRKSSIDFRMAEEPISSIRHRKNTPLRAPPMPA